MGIIKAALAGARSGAQTGRRAGRVQRLLQREFGVTPRGAAARRRFAELVDYLPAETPDHDLAVCYLSVEVMLGAVSPKAGDGMLDTARMWFLEGLLSESILREFTRALKRNPRG